MKLNIMIKYLLLAVVLMVCNAALVAEAQENPQQSSESSVDETSTQPSKPATIEESVLGMNVSGTKDLPNVLYIIPWKANSGQVSPPEISRLVETVYEPVDPEVFTKRVNFYYQLNSTKSDKKQSVTAD